MPDRRILPAVACLALSACSMAPDYRPPDVPMAATCKEAPGWAAATPMDGQARGPWWTWFGDPVLDALIARAERASPTLAAALARYDQALATVRIERSGLFPQADVSGQTVRQRASGNRPVAQGGAQTYSVTELGGVLSYEADLWGRIRNSVRAARAEAEASRADLVSARLSLTAAVADAYLRLRGFDAEAHLLQRSAEGFRRAYELTSTRHEGGLASGIDVARARTLLGNARAQLSAVASARAAAEHEIAALIGEAASGFTLASIDGQPAPPAIPGEVPAALLQRRPDVAAAERRMSAANARIGVARAAFFPAVRLAASGGVQSSGGDLLSTASTFWALGPVGAVLNIFDGGQRRGRVQLSRAEYEEEAALYRDTVLTAIRQVEDALAATRLLERQELDQRDAAGAAERSSELALTRYRDGAAGYLEVVVAQTDALVAARAALQVRTQRTRAAVQLVRALGGDATVPIPAAT